MHSSESRTGYIMKLSEPLNDPEEKNIKIPLFVLDYNSYTFGLPILQNHQGQSVFRSICYYYTLLYMLDNGKLYR